MPVVTRRRQAVTAVVLSIIGPACAGAHFDRPARVEAGHPNPIAAWRDRVRVPCG
jgi:hypothetical protein